MASHYRRHDKPVRTDMYRFIAVANTFKIIYRSTVGKNQKESKITSLGSITHTTLLSPSAMVRHVLLIA